MTKDEKLNNIIESYWHSNLTIYEALDKAYMEGSLIVAVKYQNDINDRIDQMNEILGTLQEIKTNGK